MSRHTVVVVAVRGVVIAKRVLRPALQRHVLARVGAVLVIAGASVMLHTEQHIVPNTVWEATWFFVHGWGSTPLVKPLEGFWSVLAGRKV